MMISTKGRYALRVMLDLAGHRENGYIPLAEIAARQKISEKYLESILSVLSKAGMLDALRGKGGGYRLAKAPADYSVYDILCLTEGTLAPVTCLEAGQSCENAGACSTYPLWQGLDEVPVRIYAHGCAEYEKRFGIIRQPPKYYAAFSKYFVGADASVRPQKIPFLRKATVNLKFPQGGQGRPPLRIDGKFCTRTIKAVIKDHGLFAAFGQ